MILADDTDAEWHELVLEQLIDSCDVIWRVRHPLLRVTQVDARDKTDLPLEFEKVIDHFGGLAGQGDLEHGPALHHFALLRAIIEDQRLVLVGEEA